MTTDASESSAVGFWSYVRADDDAEGGRIVRLAERLRSEYSVLTGGDLGVFVDREDISWGDEWRRRITEALTGTTFFIPIVTPRYFRSEECRRELLTFAGHARSFGVTELLLPILYAEVAALDENSLEDGLRRIVDAQAIIDEWVRVIQESDVDCSGD